MFRETRVLGPTAFLSQRVRCCSMPAQASILQHILGICARAKHAVGNAEQSRAMPLEIARAILHWVHGFEILEFHLPP
jgi:hypothetical protein